MLTELTVEQALDQIRSRVLPLPVEELPIGRAAGLLLAGGVAAPMDQPPFDRSPLDGYALRAADTAGASREHPVRLTVTDTVYAGGCPRGSLSAGQAARIMTGGMLPAGCDCVIRQEDTDLGAETVEIYRELKPWSNYVRAGEDFRAGDVLLPAGARLDAAAFAVLSSAGFSPETGTVRARPLPRVAVICTGVTVRLPWPKENIASCPSFCSCWPSGRFPALVFSPPATAVACPNPKRCAISATRSAPSA